MNSWAAWLLSLVEPIAKRAAIALGFGFVSYEGAKVAVEAALASMQSALSGLVGEVAALLARAGFFEALSIMAGGIIAGMAWTAVTRFARVGTGAASA